ncbi:MAG: Fe-S cluster assembly ATPase SufC [Ruminococcus sp.]|nr:Fe-S cluster assembly ATPase SufC [Ruminococcus sp.]
MAKLLKINGLYAGIEEKELLHGISLEIDKGETHVLMGPNGAGKSTLGHTLMGSPEYEVTGGTIEFDGEDITELGADKRAQKGLFLSFQNPIEIPGISLSAFLRSALEQRTGERIKLMAFQKKLRAAMEVLQMDPEYAERDLNVGFSGGEKKKAEILQLLMLDPRLAILDETDSGLDVDAVKTVSAGVAEYRRENENSLLIITHNTKILESLKVDRTHIIAGGRIVAEGGPELIEDVNKNGFEKYVQAERGEA